MSTGAVSSKTTHESVTTKLMDALVELSASKPVSTLSVAELCRCAHVSRSAFYLHYSHIREVYDDVVERMMGNLQLFHDNVGCRECMSGDKLCFCEFIRKNPDWKGIYRDGQFLDTYINIAFDQPEYGYLKLLEERGLTRKQAEVMFTFHINGCYAMALAKHLQNENLDQHRLIIDAFFRGGHDAACNAVAKSKQTRS